MMPPAPRPCSSESSTIDVVGSQCSPCEISQQCDDDSSISSGVMIDVSTVSAVFCRQISRYPSAASRSSSRVASPSSECRIGSVVEQNKFKSSAENELSNSISSYVLGKKLSPRERKVRVVVSE